VKKLINSSLLAVCVLFGSSQTSAMLNKFLTIAGVGIVGSLGKKYLYDPLKTQIKYRKYLAPQNIQELSDQLLNDHQKIHGGGFKKKLLVKYLKMFGYNKVYAADLGKLFGESTGFTSQAICRPKGGIFIKKSVTKNETNLTEIVGHETSHLYHGDTIRSARKLYRYQIESRACETNAKTLFYSGYFAVFLHALQQSKLCEIKPNDSISKGEQRAFPELQKTIEALNNEYKKLEKLVREFEAPYINGSLSGLQKILKEDPNHPSVKKFVTHVRTHEQEILKENSEYPIIHKLVAYTKARKNVKQPNQWFF